MSEKRPTPTISAGLGLNDDFFKEAEVIVIENLNKYDTISDALAATALTVRDGDLGEVDIKLTAYEKKLVLSGFIMGCVRAKTEMESKGDLLKTLKDVKGTLLGKKGGKAFFGGDKLPKGLIEAMLNDPNLPEELRNILGEIEGIEGDDDDE